MFLSLYILKVIKYFIYKFYFIFFVERRQIDPHRRPSRTRRHDSQITRKRGESRLRHE